MLPASQGWLTIHDTEKLEARLRGESQASEARLRGESQASEARLSGDIQASEARLEKRLDKLESTLEAVSTFFLSRRALHVSAVPG